MSDLNNLIYKGNEPYIFISYSHKDSSIVYPIIELLIKKGFRVWFDTGIEAGTEWPEYIAEHIDKCDCFISFISANSLESHNCRREIHFAIELQKKFLSVYLEEVNLTPGMRMQLNALQSMFFYKSPSSEIFISKLSEAEIVQASFATNKVDTSSDYETTPDEWYNIAEKHCRGIGTERDYSKAFYYYKKAAELGHVKAQFDLAQCYRLGKGTPTNLPDSVYWYNKSAEQGYSVAQNYLGFCYELGQGVNKNFAKAFYWYQKSAQQGYSIAQNNLGVCLELGHGTEKDSAKAFYWYQKSAEQGHSFAQYNLGRCYYDGIGVKKDFSQALIWLKKSAEQGNENAKELLEKIRRS